MKVIAKIKALFVVLAILLVLLGIGCIAGKAYLDEFRDDVKDKGVRGITKVEYIGGVMDYDDFMDKSESDMKTMGAAAPVCFALAAGCIVLFAMGESKAKKLKAEKAGE